MGYLLVILSAICFGSYGVWSRVLGTSFGIFYQGWVRSAIVLLLILPFVRKRHFAAIPTQAYKWFAVVMISTIFTQVPLYVAFNHVSLATATLTFYGLFLLTTYAVGWGCLKEQITPVKILSCFLALMGLSLTCAGAFAACSLFPLLLAALNGVASGTEIAVTKKVPISSLQIMLYSWLVILLTHLPCSLLFAETQIIPAWDMQWGAMLGYAVSGLGGFWLAIEGFKRVDASIGGLLGLLEILFSALFGIWLFNDALTGSLLLGGGLILISAMLPDLYALRSVALKSKRETNLPE